MSIDHEYANPCSGKNCTNLLTSRTEHKNGYCLACEDEKFEKNKKTKGEK